MTFPQIEGLRAMEFATPGALRTRLVELVVSGQKTATAGLLSEYEAESEPVEHVGERLVVVDNELRPMAVIEVTRVELSRFADVPDEFALAEGEGDLDGDDFRASHLAYWNGEGSHVDDDTLLVLVHFTLVERLDV